MRAPILALAMIAIAEPAGANGYLFFNENTAAEKLTYAGAIVDTQGRAVEGAQIAITILSINYTIIVTTDADGVYRTSAAPYGDNARFRIKAFKPGFAVARTIAFNPVPPPGRPIVTNFIFARR